VNSQQNLNQENYLRKLNNATTLLLCTDDWAALREAAADLYKLFSAITNISAESFYPEDSSDTLLDYGLALSPKGAAFCLLEYIRTAKFLRGLRAAIIEARRRFPPKSPVHVLYAGCGPFAPLAIPLATQFSVNDVQFTLLDIHQRSLDAARQIVETFGLANFIKDYVQADATSYRHDGATPIHLVVTETMQRALSGEPHLAVTANLAPQLCEGGLLIPEEVCVEACLAQAEKFYEEIPPWEEIANMVWGAPESHKDRIGLGQLISLTAQNADAWQRNNFYPDNENELCKPLACLSLPLVSDERLTLMLQTSVTIWRDIRLEPYQSTITYPVMLDDMKPFDHEARVEFRYCLSANPRIKYLKVPAP
jgi:hypothetical protein